jgi:FkbM family methyltransferase
MYEVELKHIELNEKVSLPFYCREGTNDWNTMYSMVKEDEYQLDKYDIEDSDIVVDIGSYTGGLSLALHARDLHPWVYCFDPIPENVKLAYDNAKVNDIHRKVQTDQLIVAGKSGRVNKVYYGGGNKKGDHHRFVGNVHGMPKGDSIKVPTISLDDIFRINQIRRCKLLKIDCEGGEYDIFNGASDATLSVIEWITGEYHKGWKGIQKRLVDTGLFTEVEGSGDQRLSLFTLKRA